MPTLEVWMLDDGTPGHWSMTEGLARLLAEHRELTTHRVAVHWRWGPARQWFQWMMRMGLGVPCPLRAGLLKLDLPATATRPDLILSRGGATLYPSAWLARRHGAANVFIGTLRKLPESRFRAVVLQRDEPDRPPYVSLPLAPTRIDPRALPAKAAAFEWTQGHPGGDLACLLVGGDGSGHHYRKQDWQELADGIRGLHRATGIRWCLSTSRRTPPEAEARIRDQVPGSAIAEACWWHQGDRRPCLEAFLGVSGRAFCTSDSMSMLEECAAAGLPVIALSPRQAEPPTPFAAFLRRREEAGRMMRLAISAFATLEQDPVAARPWNPVQPGEMSGAVGRLLDQLEL